MTRRNGASNANFVRGAFAAAAVYQYVNSSATPGDLGTTLTSVPGLYSQSTAQLDVSYGFRIVKLYAQYMNIEDRSRTGNFHGNTAQAGVSVPIGVGALLASYAYTRLSGVAADGQRRSTGALGYRYPLSKRTDLYTAIKLDHFSGESTGVTYGTGMRTAFDAAAYSDASFNQCLHSPICTNSLNIYTRSRKMNLSIANVWLAQDMVGFSDIRRFAERCRDASSSGGHEAAALVLLAQAAATFAERHEGIAVDRATVRTFLGNLRADVQRLSDASGESDAALLAELNHFAAGISQELFV